MTPRLGLRARHERTLESLYRRHAADVHRYALMMLDSPADAEDVTQTTFLNAYRALLRGERPRASGRWLRTIAHNLCLQHFRQASRRPRQVELEDEAAELVRDDHGFLVDDLGRALRQIPVNQRAALLMRELEGRPIAEIADVLDVSRSAVETLLFRARRGVREQLEGGLTCAEAEEAISRQLDGDLKRRDRGALRAHLRECEECAHLARSLRAQRGAIRSLGAIPLPAALAWSKFGAGAAVGAVASANAGVVAAGGAWLAGSVAAKLVSGTLLAATAAGVSYVAAVDHPWTSAGHTANVPVRVAATAAGDSSAPDARSAPRASVPVTFRAPEHARPARERTRRSVPKVDHPRARAPSSRALAALGARAHARAGAGDIARFHGRDWKRSGRHERAIRLAKRHHREKHTHAGPHPHPHPAKPTHRAHLTHPGSAERRKGHD
jgi:RNA polymerase sigma factor (sigma-70 family)